jgi:methylphosphotriester-DNA--protein-cysteine methyltransferase
MAFDGRQRRTETDVACRESSRSRAATRKNVAFSSAVLAMPAINS